MRYYLYVSERKIDMLHPQTLPAFQKDNSTELKVGISSTSFSRKSSSSAADNYHTKIEAIELKLREDELVGTNIDPNEWIYGVEEMAWNVVPDWGISLFFTASYPDEGQPIVAIGGSTNHIISSTPSEQEPNQLTGSHLHHIGSFLHDNIDQGIAKPNQSSSIWSSTYDARPEEPGHSLHEYCEIFSYKRKYPEINVPIVRIEYLAKVLWRGSAEGSTPRNKRPGIIGTPLFVAMAD